MNKNRKFEKILKKKSNKTKELLDSLVARLKSNEPVVQKGECTCCPIHSKTIKAIESRIAELEYAASIYQKLALGD